MNQNVGVFNKLNNSHFLHFTGEKRGYFINSDIIICFSLMTIVRQLKDPLSKLCQECCRKSTTKVRDPKAIKYSPSSNHKPNQPKTGLRLISQITRQEVLAIWLHQNIGVWLQI